VGFAREKKNNAIYRPIREPNSRFCGQSLRYDPQQALQRNTCCRCGFAWQRKCWLSRIYAIPP